MDLIESGGGEGGMESGSSWLRIGAGGGHEPVGSGATELVLVIRLAKYQETLDRVSANMIRRRYML
jgi:hypothetical protein